MLSRKANGRPNVVLPHTVLLGDNSDVRSSRELVKQQRDRNARALDDRLPEANVRVHDDSPSNLDGLPPRLLHDFPLHLNAMLKPKAT